jgi:NADPH:quinone reductase-like Zn-dependent oxidoreductase
MPSRVRDCAKLPRDASGKRVLVNGAAGGVGTFAVQIAKAFGAHVSGVCSTRNVELVRSIGADEVFDYTRENFVQAGITNGTRYHVILDNQGNHPYSEVKKILHPEGMYVGVGGPHDGWEMLATIPRVLWLNAVDKRHTTVLAKSNAQDLTLLGELMASGKIKAVIDSRYPLEQSADALRHLEEGHARGKVIITVAA